MKALSLPKSMRSRLLPRVAVVVVLFILVVFGAVPSYFTGNWSWKEPPPVANLSRIRALRETGLNIPGWKTLEHKIETIGGHKWSVQIIERDNKLVRLLLLPQGDDKSQPQVEWMDIKGFEQWKTDSYSSIQFTVETLPLEQQASSSKLTTPPSASVEALFFRAYPRPDLRPNQRKLLRTDQLQTKAVLQWYAWSQGGDPAPSRWFWADQLAQLHRNRVPWVAVCLQIPIKPIGDIEQSRPLAESLAKMVQSALMADPLDRAAIAQ